MSVKSIGQLLGEFLQKQADNAADPKIKEKWDDVAQRGGQKPKQAVKPPSMKD